MTDLEKAAVAQIQMGVATLVALGHCNVIGWCSGGYDGEIVKVESENPNGGTRLDESVTLERT